ncbi:MAG TPA: RNA polymerase factor sigma-54 [Tissierellia bacterium]|nr:RNA polymerase factor sigma-54 [Tissierellia bacterium]
MDLTLKQELRQKQVLSQQLKQSLLILQLSALDLEAHLNEELEINPLLEREQEVVLPSRISGDLSFIRAHQPTMADQLRTQLYQQPAPERTLVIADYLINYLDDNGFLDLAMDDPRLKHLSQSSLSEAIELIQSLEPTGIGARNLGECLYLQLKKQQPIPDHYKTLLLEDLNELAKGNLHRLMDKYDLERQELMELLEAMSGLDPRPGAALSPVEPEYIIPDLTIHSVDPLEIELSPHSFPSLRYNHSYDAYMKDADSRDFLKEKQSRAKLILYALEQRATTMRRIIRVLVDLQPDFFTPSKALHILNRQDVADELELHNSTVSRAVKDKYFLWENQVYPMAIFFPKGVKRRDGTGISSPIIQREMLKLIEDEPPGAPLSDQRIKELLEQRGLQIARRTVTKYRRQLGISRANLRRRSL